MADGRWREETATKDEINVNEIGPIKRNRLDGIDVVRGLVMVIMALDHVKGHFSNANFDFVDLSRTTPAYFLTRWITHLCAPTFVFLAGTGAFLYGARGKTKNQQAWFLFSRGLWLIILELTVIRYAWFLDLTYQFSVGQVIWAIGWSMIVLSGLVYLPVSFTTVFGVAMIAFHNLFDFVKPEDWGSLGWLWSILHTGNLMEIQLHWEGWRPLLDVNVFARGGPSGPVQGILFAPMYPLIPWIGVLAAGYGFGAMMLLDRSRRRWEVFGLGLALILTFIALRYANLYGDKIRTAAPNGPPPGTLPGPWAERSDLLYTFFSFINCEKYPPSLLFLLVTLGPALVILALVDREPGPIARFFVIFGRVPLFFYLLHWYVIKGVLFGLGYLNDGVVPSGPRNGLSLPLVYAIWAGVVLFLFPLCYWFAGVKQRSRAAWLSYF